MNARIELRDQSGEIVAIVCKSGSQEARDMLEQCRALAKSPSVKMRELIMKYKPRTYQPIGSIYPPKVIPELVSGVKSHL
jgi:hypothetical protein